MRPHSISARRLLVEKCALMMILDALYWTVSIISFHYKDAAAHIGATHSRTVLISAVLVLRRVIGLEPHVEPHNFLRIFSFFKALSDIISLYLVNLSSVSYVRLRYFGLEI